MGFVKFPTPDDQELLDEGLLDFWKKEWKDFHVLIPLSTEFWHGEENFIEDYFVKLKKLLVKRYPGINVNADVKRYSVGRWDEEADRLLGSDEDSYVSEIEYWIKTEGVPQAMGDRFWDIYALRRPVDPRSLKANRPSPLIAKGKFPARQKDVELKITIPYSLWYWRAIVAEPDQHLVKQRRGKWAFRVRDRLTSELSNFLPGRFSVTTSGNMRKPVIEAGALYSEDFKERLTAWINGLSEYVYRKSANRSIGKLAWDPNLASVFSTPYYKDQGE